MAGKEKALSGGRVPLLVGDVEFGHDDIEVDYRSYRQNKNTAHGKIAVCRNCGYRGADLSTAGNKLMRMGRKDNRIVHKAVLIGPKTSIWFYVATEVCHQQSG